VAAQLAASQEGLSSVSKYDYVQPIFLEFEVVEAVIMNSSIFWDT
jgi:hypothetical protein